MFVWSKCCVFLASKSICYDNIHPMLIENTPNARYMYIQIHANIVMGADVATAAAATWIVSIVSIADSNLDRLLFVVVVFFFSLHKWSFEWNNAMHIWNASICYERFRNRARMINEPAAFSMNTWISRALFCSRSLSLCRSRSLSLSLARSLIFKEFRFTGHLSSDFGHIKCHWKHFHKILMGMDLHFMSVRVHIKIIA